MRVMMIALAGFAMAAAPAAPLLAKKKDQTQWVYNGRSYESYEQCRKARKKSGDRAAVAGAATAGAVTAIAGGSLAETALVAGAGALAGSVIGKNTKKC